MIGSDEIREIQRIIMGFFRQARCYRKHWMARRYHLLHTYFHELLAAALTLELMEQDLVREVR